MSQISEIGEQVAAGRKQRRLTQSALARAAGVSRATIDLLENGRAVDIGYSRLARILAVVGLELRLAPASTERPTLEDLLREDADD
ncbi:MAG: helix-turn-helix domain-containing protein [Terracidiphilus sp.]